MGCSGLDISGEYYTCLVIGEGFWVFEAWVSAAGVSLKLQILLFVRLGVFPVVSRF